MAEGILIWNELKEMLQTALEITLLIDCRPFLAYNSGHISSAHNIHCPPIVKRRAGGCLPMENIVRCPETLSKLSDGQYKFVVVYDENTHSLDHLSSDSNMGLVLKSLRDNLVKQSVCFLQGGYNEFRLRSPDMCVCSASTESESSDSTKQEWFTPLTSKIPASGGGFSQTRPAWDEESEESPSTSSSSNNTILRDTIKYRPTDDQGDPQAILPWLFLGSAYHALQEQRLCSMGITALLNMASKSDTLTPSPGFLHKRVAVEDSCTTDISFWFPEVIHFIESVRQRGGKVLVHCHAGISRSATVCIAYVMWYRHWSMEKAYSYLKSRRSLIAPNLNFMRQLHEFECQLEENGRSLRAEPNGEVGGAIQENGRSLRAEPHGEGGGASPAPSQSSNSGHSSSSSYLSSFSTCEEAGWSPRVDQQQQLADASSRNSPRFKFDSSYHPHQAALRSLSLGGGGGGEGISPKESAPMDQEVFLQTPSSHYARPSSLLQGSVASKTIADFVASIPQSSPCHQSQPPCLSASLFSTGLRSPLLANQAANLSQTASGKQTFNRPLTPCTRQANVFSFDSSVVSPLTPHTHSPTLTMCHSPLVSPS